MAEKKDTKKAPGKPAAAKSGAAKKAAAPKKAAPAPGPQGASAARREAPGAGRGVRRIRISGNGPGSERRLDRHPQPAPVSRRDPLPQARRPRARKRPW